MVMRLINGDCLIEMANIEDKVDLVLTDLPYGNTDIHWDNALPLDVLWEHWKRILKPNGVVLLFGMQPFTYALYASNPKWFKYPIYWKRSRKTGFLDANIKPLRCIEEILVFYNKKPSY